ncbi:MAG: hypothetical protein WDO73_14585 [Ignavibacteriota bacterium]
MIDAGGPNEAYRVQTDTGDGVLRRASLTLRGKALRPTDGRFQFVDEEPLEISETSAPASSEKLPPQAPARDESPKETPASPADTLHVLAALNEIGADVTDPIVVTEDDRRQVVVRAQRAEPEAGSSKSPAALSRLPHVRLEFDATSNSHAPVTIRAAGTTILHRDAGSVATPIGRSLGRRYRTAGSSPTRSWTRPAWPWRCAHAIETLAGKFPPDDEQSLAAADRELLHTLRQRHASELQRLSLRIRAALKPLLAATFATIGHPASGAWQSEVSELVTAALQVDSSLNRLLAGSFSQSQGDAMLRELNGELERLEKAIHAQQDGGR